MIARILQLVDLVETSDSETMAELGDLVSRHTVTQDLTAVPACALFIKLLNIPVAKLSLQDYKLFLADRGRLIARNAQNQLRETAINASHFLPTDSTILVLGNSPALRTLLEIAPPRRAYTSVKATLDLLLGLNIDAKLVQANTYATLIDQVDFCLVDCHVVCKNGGLVAPMGTFTLAVVCKALSKPFYCITPTFNFVALFFLNHHDLADWRQTASTGCTSAASATSSSAKSKINSTSATSAVNAATSATSTRATIAPRLNTSPALNTSLDSARELELSDMDYTPPEFISLLFTNAGALTPSAVAEQITTVSLENM